MLCIFMLIKEGIICSKCDWIDVLMDESINSGEQVQTWQNRHSMRISLQNCNFIHCSANQKQRLENLFIQIHCASNRHPKATSTQRPLTIYMYSALEKHLVNIVCMSWVASCLTVDMFEQMNSLCKQFRHCTALDWWYIVLVDTSDNNWRPKNANSSLDFRISSHMK